MPTTELSRPLLAVYIVWHPGFSGGQQIADALHEHFRRKPYENVSGGTGLSVLYRSAPAPGATVPHPIDLTAAHTTAVVLLADESLAAVPEWRGYVRALVGDSETQGLSTRVFPVSIDSAVLGTLALEEQALRWDQWGASIAERCRRLRFDLSYELCRMLRHFIAFPGQRGDADNALPAFLEPVQVFISHSKHDTDGVVIARAIRAWLQESHGLSSFFDVHDIPAGLRFSKVLLHQVRVSAMVAIHTDSYSSREWCRREIIEAKRHSVPLVVADSISDLDERGFPYMGNVPVVRLDCEGTHRIDLVIGRLLEEVLKNFLWRCRIALAAEVAGASVVFLPRPPELISLAALPPRTELPDPVLVYPDPPVSAEEELLFDDVAPQVRLRSFTQWLAGVDDAAS